MYHFKPGISTIFYQVALRIAAHAHHAMLLKFLLEIVVELIAMAMALLDMLLLIDVEHATSLVSVRTRRRRVAWFHPCLICSSAPP